MTRVDDHVVTALRALVQEPGPGDVLDDRFELGELLGEGAMGVVYAAWDRETSREVAVKVALRQGGSDEARAAREAAALEKVTHPALVRFMVRGRCGDIPFFVMERVRGVTLAERLAQGPLAVASAVALGARLADALAAVHAAGITHRDVKPSNVMLEEGGAGLGRLLDLGVARASSTPPLTLTGALVGTPGYVAPEQVRGEGDVGPGADVFALGCLLFECLAGRPAFSADATDALLAKILLETPPPLRELRAEVPQALETLLTTMLAKNASGRPSAADAANALVALSGHLSTEPASNSPRATAEGTTIAGKYRIEERLGQGGMGIIVAARHLELGKRVALKLLSSGKTSDAPRLLREAKAASRLESEHVARVLDVGRTDDGTPYIVMEYLPGNDLARHLSQHGPLAIDVAVGYVLEACEALAEAHALGIVHRDVKPSNLFLVSRRDGSRSVKVLDFGISKLTRSLDEGSSEVSGSLTGGGTVMGSVAYMSPEQLQDPSHVDARTDIWALGVVLYEFVTGTRPFEGDGPAAIARIAGAEPRRLRDVRPDAPEALETAIQRCLEKAPGRRFANVTTFARAIAPFAESHAGTLGQIARTLGSESEDRSAQISRTREAEHSRVSPHAGRRTLVGAAVVAAIVAIVGVLLRAGPRDASSEPAAVRPASAAADTQAPIATASAGATATPTQLAVIPTAPATLAVSGSAKPLPGSAARPTTSKRTHRPDAPASHRRRARPHAIASASRSAGSTPPTSASSPSAVSTGIATTPSPPSQRAAQQPNLRDPALESR